MKKGLWEKDYVKKIPLFWKNIPKYNNVKFSQNLKYYKMFKINN